ncbi:polysaccharide deacetylase family protein [Roseovarius sp. 2305UL8-3]|uniref:polysaccharide deacetylase family protein n=1 Tax=Roseovarius conchicola TaxID=3121636 RepID=UPI00352850B4
MTDWTPLATELQQWQAEGLKLPFWWRDDDAVSDTPALRDLARMAQEAGLPVHLAVIPAHADATLAARVTNTPTLIPVVHGWSHDNHAPASQKKAEFGAHRPLDVLESEARNGLNRLQTLFGADVKPLFVPPWNRIAPDLVPRLPDCGFHTLSTFTPRAKAHPAPGLTQINTHIDPINWRGGGGLVEESALIAHTTKLLQDRRAGRADASEPLGLLTHHLVHDASIWSFCARLVAVLMDGPATPWITEKEPPK